MEEFYSELEKWYKENFTESTLGGSTGCELRYAFQEGTGAAGILLIVSGRTEFVEKYLELSRDFQDTGLSICMYDHCGQGGSGRLLADRQKGHIDNFTTYVNDLDIIIEAINEKYGFPPIYLLTHSMGGTVSVMYVARHPEKIRALILVSPMFQINTGFFLSAMLFEGVSALLTFWGTGELYVFGGGPFDPSLPFAENKLTTDKRRFILNLNLMEQINGVVLGGPTFGWLSAAYKAMRQLRKEAALITCPILLMVAMGDSVIGIEEARRFRAAASDCLYKTYNGAQHELLMESDTIRTKVIREIKVFLEQQAGM